eukprot:314891-Amphidinium_carterae.1
MPAPGPGDMRHSAWSDGELLPGQPWFYTDGSGCQQTKTHKLAAWAYVQVDAGGRALAAAAALLTPPDAYDCTVYEAELRALHAVLQHTTWDIDVGTDSAAVLQGWLQGRDGSIATSGKFAAVWTAIWDSAAARRVRVFKVQAHQPEPSHSPAWLHWRGNMLADSYAKQMLSQGQRERPQIAVAALWEDRVQRLVRWIGHQGGQLTR